MTFLKYLRVCECPLIHTRTAPVHTCDLIGKDGIEDLALLGLFFATHISIASNQQPISRRFRSGLD